MRIFDLKRGMKAWLLLGPELDVVVLGEFRGVGADMWDLVFWVESRKCWITMQDPGRVMPLEGS